MHYFIRSPVFSAKRIIQLLIVFLLSVSMITGAFSYLHTTDLKTNSFNISDSIPAGNYVTLMRHGVAIARLPIEYSLVGSTVSSESVVDIEAYEDSDPTYLGFLDETGTLRDTNVNAAELLMTLQEENSSDYFVTNPNPILYSIYNASERIDGDGNTELPVKLIPSSVSSPGVVQRGIVGSISSVYHKDLIESHVSVDDFNSNFYSFVDNDMPVIFDEEVSATYGSSLANGFDMWLLYGIHERCSLSDFSSIFRVQGDGYMLISDMVDNLITTGTLVRVYRSSDDSLVESFHVVLRGDINGDGSINDVDRVFMREEIAGNTGWSWYDDGEFNPPMWRAGDLHVDRRISSVDATDLYDICSKTHSVNQSTGLISELS